MGHSAMDNFGPDFEPGLTQPIEVEFSEDLRRATSGWFLGVGGLLVILGIVAAANLAFSTTIALDMIGVVMMIAGAFQFAHAVAVHRIGASLLWLLVAVLYAVAGLLVFTNPHLTVLFLTAAFAMLIGFAGLTRVILGLQNRDHHGWAITSGLISIAGCVVILMGWPGDSVWIAGLILAVDLLIQGLVLGFIGWRLRRSGGGNAP